MSEWPRRVPGVTGIYRATVLVLVVGLVQSVVIALDQDGRLP